MNKIEHKWHVMTCPTCEGAGMDDYFRKCDTCLGKKLVKLDLDELVEYVPPTS